jgi:hypothetical protein
MSCQASPGAEPLKPGAKPFKKFKPFKRFKSFGERYGKGGAKRTKLVAPGQAIEMTVKFLMVGLGNSQSKGAKRSCFDTPPVANLMHLPRGFGFRVSGSQV